MAAAAKTKSVLLLALLTAALALSATASNDEVNRFHGRRRRRSRNGGRNTSPTPPNRPVPSPRAPSSPPPSAPGYLIPCGRPDVPPALAATAQNSSAGGNPRTDCIPSRAPPPPPQPRFRRPTLCTCPKPPGFGAGAPGGGGAGGSSLGLDCVAPLAPLMVCGAFITGAAEDTPTPQSECCVGLSTFLNQSREATAAGNGDGGLRCLCPVIIGGVNKVLPRPVDPVRLMYLPIACGVVLPPQTLFSCFTGQPTSQVAVSKFYQIMEQYN